ncbi:PTB domain-containing engulfment adapter protein 1 isoform X2 [Xiphophorus couchianus]|uniref:PTB domain-containing engulfment adapter protein 1 isoform X2 n=1 Tax=Xiphophorus couchianus TaxID=32473 RepID=UPI001017039A|nr:PTB domain-containing engulfment adapter protein 1-like isoform X2 [Xiphophorus couchianus]
MSDILEDESDISFTAKFLGRVEVVRPSGQQILEEAVQSVKPEKFNSEKAAKKSKVLIFLSMSGIDILEYKTKFLLYSCPLPTVSFCAVLRDSPKVFGFIAQHPAADMYHCYLFQSQKLAPVLVSAIGDAFRASRKEQNVRGGRDLVVEALRHKNKVLQRENDELRRKLGGHIYEALS